MKLASLSNEQEALLLRLLGIAPLQDGETDIALLLGREHTPPEEVDLYLRLPDAEAPEKEIDELARLLGRAIGVGKVHL